jgi:predicted DNA-binding antitoxin AbrB/MazE fold protein
MNNPIIAVYEKGVLKPLIPLTLPEHTEVQIYLTQTSVCKHSENRRRVKEALIAAGLSLHLSQQEISAPCSELSPERREELARLFAEGGPLSDLIIAERNEEHG